MNVEAQEYEKIQAYQNETGKQVLYPTIAKRNRPDTTYAGQDTVGNYYYKTGVRLFF